MKIVVTECHEGQAARAEVWASREAYYEAKDARREGRLIHPPFASRADQPVTDCRHYIEAQGQRVEGIIWT
jgi:hypothetical protein